MTAIVGIFKNIFFLFMSEETIGNKFFNITNPWEIEQMIQNNNHILLFIGIWITMITVITIVTILTTLITKKIIKIMKIKNKQRKGEILIDN